MTSSCTLAGCHSSFTLHVVDADDQPVTGLAGTITLGSRTWAVDCLGESDEAVSCHEGTIRISHQGRSDEVLVDLDGEAGSVTGSAPVQWSQSAPNGDRCGPVCNDGRATVALDDPGA